MDVVTTIEYFPRIIQVLKSSDSLYGKYISGNCFGGTISTVSGLILCRLKDGEVDFLALKGNEGKYICLINSQYPIAW